MPTFRQRPSRRRERSLTTNTLVTGFAADVILGGERRTVLVPLRRERDGDGKLLAGPHHWKRYAVGQLLSVKEYIPGPTACKVRLVFVHGPRGDGSASNTSFTLGDVDPQVARELGHFRQDAFWRHWLVNQDQDWYVDQITEDEPASDEVVAARFEEKWKDTPVWLLRFDVETSEEPARFLARGGGAKDFKAGEDKRWYHAPRTEAEQRESDRGYTASLALAADELPGLSDADWERHVSPESRYREQDRLAERRREREAKAHPARLDAARKAARAKGCDISREVRLYNGHVVKGNEAKALRQLELIEARVFPVAA